MTNADWWAKQLGTQPAPAPRSADVPMPPSQQPMTPYVAPQPQVQTTKAKSAAQTTPCPDCGGANFMSVANAAPRCYDCGYPITQAGSSFGSLAGAHVEGAARPANGNDTASNWNPQGIIGRVN